MSASPSSSDILHRPLSPRSTFASISFTYGEIGAGVGCSCRRIGVTRQRWRFGVSTSVTTLLVHTCPEAVKFSLPSISPHSPSPSRYHQTRATSLFYKQTRTHILHFWSSQLKHAQRRLKREICSLLDEVGNDDDCGYERVIGAYQDGKGDHGRIAGATVRGGG